MEKQNRGERYWLLDAVRGSCMISMVLYHAVYDMTELFGMHLPWFYRTAGYVWQQSICWTFILLSGFCWSLGRKPLVRGLVVFACGGMISLVTVLFLPEQQVLFGILTFLGFAMILMTAVNKLVKQIPPAIGLLAGSMLFVISRNLNRGELGFESLKLMQLPEQMYESNWLVWLGFPSEGFYSTDYFSLFPWFFLYLSGYFLWKWIGQKEGADRVLSCRIAFLSKAGRHSLLIYMLHQPALIAVLTVAEKILSSVKGV